MREIYNRMSVVVNVEDDPDASGAPHVYTINFSGRIRGGGLCDDTTFFRFQQGPIQEVGPNGITNESLLVIVIDRLMGFQKGPFPCRENALAITKLQEAMHWLEHRTRDREDRGVEGVNKP